MENYTGPATAPMAIFNVFNFPFPISYDRKLSTFYLNISID